MENKILKPFFVGLWILIAFLITQVKIPAQKVSEEKSYQRLNVKKDEARDEVGRAIFSIGFSAPAIGNDPCQGIEKTLGGLKHKPKGAAEITGLPTKPTTSLGKQGQAQEGESEITFLPADNVCYEGYDSEGRKCVEATINPDRTTTFKNTSDNKCVVMISDKYTLALAPKTEITLNTERKEPNPVVEAAGKVRSFIMDNLPDWAKPTPAPTKASVVGVRGNCDPYGITGGCRVKTGYGIALPTLPEYLNAMAEKEIRGQAERLKWSRVNPSPEGSTPAGGMKLSETYPGKSAKSGYEKEKGSKMDKKETIINPSDSAPGKGGRSIDFCGRNLPTPEQAASMGFDPGRITDPAYREWTGRLEQRGTEITLTWSKTMATDRGEIKVEYTY
ncbi:MAG: hypothetical protein N3B16_03335 [Candidatus Aminicenantes bacterium]|nr:hypothetical protein [Candidatus Aminicenantes bacterium]